MLWGAEDPVQQLQLTQPADLLLAADVAGLKSGEDFPFWGWRVKQLECGGHSCPCIQSAVNRTWWTTGAGADAVDG